MNAWGKGLAKKLSKSPSAGHNQTEALREIGLSRRGAPPWDGHGLLDITMESVGLAKSNGGMPETSRQGLWHRRASLAGSLAFALYRRRMLLTGTGPGAPGAAPATTSSLFNVFASPRQKGHGQLPAHSPTLITARGFCCRRVNADHRIERQPVGNGGQISG